MTMRNRMPLHGGHGVQVWLIIGLGARLVPTPASAEHRALDPRQSTITVHVFKSGLFRAFADNHVIQAPLKEGFLDDGASPRVEILLDAPRLHVLDPGLSPKDREQVQTRMLGPEVLDVMRFPQIRFRSTTVQRVEPDGWLVRGELTLHGQTHVVAVKVALEGGRYKGSASVKQTNFGISPISIAVAPYGSKTMCRSILTGRLDRNRAPSINDEPTCTRRTLRFQPSQRRPRPSHHTRSIEKT
jgi:hypothetical protein